jgi:glycosyltransferase involved in cell wall biosynthesis
MKILVVEPFYTGSHAAWAEGYARHSWHDVSILKLSGAHWKWRMHGGAVTLARKFLLSRERPDLILATDMLDLSTFLALTRSITADTPCALYFHENQITYPWSVKDRDRRRNRDHHYGFVNFTSALVSDRVFFNSRYHMTSFLEALPAFLGRFPDQNEVVRINEIATKSYVLPLGLDLQWLDKLRQESKHDKPLLLWNHRWEYDKNPDDFFKALGVLDQRGRAFDVAVAGEVFDVIPDAMEAGLARLGNRVVHAGFCEDRIEYAYWLWRADIQPVTSNQDFFGSSVAEAAYCNCLPLLPRRLAFPELFDGDYFYDDLDDLVERLDDAVTNIGRTRARTRSPRKSIEKYDWHMMAPRYDKALNELAASSSPK